MHSHLKIFFAGVSRDGSLSPALSEIKKELKQLQKGLSDLWAKFDRYISNEHGINSKDQTRGLHTSSSTAEKRKHSEEDEEEAGSEKKKIATDDKTKFSTDGEGFLIVYTDGACQFNGKHGAQAGVGVFFGHDHPL